VLQTLLQCIDNSGAAIVECIQVLRRKRPARIGDRIVVVVQKQRNFGPESASKPTGSTATVSAANKVRRGDIRHAVVVRTKAKVQRKDGSVVRFDDNACVLINKAGEPIGTRLGSEYLLLHAGRVDLSGCTNMASGVVGDELRKKQWSKILSLAPAHV
jgi:ribosomal protein L14